MLKRLASLVLLSSVIGLQLIQASCRAEEHQPKIAVSGSAQIKVKADTITFVGAIVSQAATIDEAADANDEKIRQLTDFIQDLQLPDGAIKTQHISLTPIYPPHDDDRKGYGKQSAGYNQTNQSDSPFDNAPNVPNTLEELKKLAPIGYEARREVAVELKDSKRFEEVYKGLLKSGLTQLDNVLFSTSKLRDYRDQARLMAVRAAKEKASAMSAELGVKLGGVLLIREENNDFRALSNAFQNSMPDPFGGSGVGSDVTAGGFEISASVQVEFELKN